MGAIFMKIGMGLGSIFLEMLMRLIGYDFISKATIMGLEAWAETTATHRDDDLVKAAAKALGVPETDLKLLLEASNKDGNNT